MNKDFTFLTPAPVQPKDEDRDDNDVDSQEVYEAKLAKRRKKAEFTVRVLYKDECVAVVRGDDTVMEQAVSHVNTYGYMAEHRRNWNNGNRVNWTDNIFVDVN